jgi:hypothetical protein
MGAEMRHPVALDCATTRCALAADSLDRRCGSSGSTVGPVTGGRLLLVPAGGGGKWDMSAVESRLRAGYEVRCGPSERAARKSEVGRRRGQVDAISF